MNGVFITGTDTGVGKTLVTGLLLRQCLQLGVDAVPMKPVQSGALLRKERLVAGDLETSLRLADGRMEPEDEADMAPYRFRHACSPHLAAELAGERIGVAKIVSCFRRLAKRHRLVLVEGAGGILVPLDRRRTMLDLAQALALPVLVVARAELGTLNHALLTVQALTGVGLNVLGIVLNRTRPGPRTYIERDNRKTLERMTGLPIFVEIPRLGGKGPGGPLAAREIDRAAIREPFRRLVERICITA
ncbi:MAG: dethiobiotin synthase [Pirellulaceae bacterium]